MKKDPALRQFMQKAPSVNQSDRFTDSVMKQLPKRNPLQTWGVAFLSVLWVGFVIWAAIWQRDLVEVLNRANWNLRFITYQAIIPYIAFLSALGILLWQTIEFLMKNFSSRNALYDCLLRENAKK